MSMASMTSSPNLPLFYSILKLFVIQQLALFLPLQSWLLPESETSMAASQVLPSEASAAVREFVSFDDTSLLQARAPVLKARSKKSAATGPLQHAAATDAMTVEQAASATAAEVDVGTPSAQLGSVTDTRTSRSN
eukprot:TRINITY_DN111690_c0_g1_i1.p1 TRINITY_DN111690_c0_g1~~TRINITY_DN111690_c0_g1_i1.p1  ORF type:complete len:135 (+),score=35.69 TRINITY_DN111690_c0_g1_i1:310-714(+)